MDLTPDNRGAVEAHVKALGWIQPGLAVGGATGLVVLLVLLLFRESRPPDSDALWAYPLIIGGCWALGVLAAWALLAGHALSGWISGGTRVDVT